MSLEILTAKELYNRGLIDAFDLRAPNHFRDRKVMVFSDILEGMGFAYSFAHFYLVPKYGKEEAAKFPMTKSGPAKENLLAELLGDLPKDVNSPMWLVVPNDRFSEVEEYLKQYDSKKAAPKPKQE